MSTYRNRLSGNEQSRRTVNEAIRKLQELTDRIFHGVSTTNLEWSPETSGQLSLGSVSRMWSNLYLAAGGAINWNNGQASITEASQKLVVNLTAGLAPQTTGYVLQLGAVNLHHVCGGI